MAEAPITLDGLQALEVEADFTAEIAFGDVFALLDRVDDLGQLLFVQILGAEGGIDVGFCEDFLRIDRPDSVDVTQRDVDAFFGGDIYSEKAWHNLFLTLTLFVARVGANDADDTFATHNLAMLAKPFD